MLFNTFRAEWTKLITTRSIWWTSAFIIVVTWAFSGGFAKFSSLPPNVAVVTTSLFTLGMPILMIQASMLVTTQYRYNEQVPTFLANPNRLQVAVVKLVLYAVLAAIITLIALAGGYLLCQLFVNPTHAGKFNPWTDAAGQRYLWRYPATAAMITLFGQGLGWLLRQTAGTVAVSLILFLGVDQMVRLIPKVGKNLIHFSPFGDLQMWLNNLSAADAPWGHNIAMNGVVFLVWGIVLWVAGVALLLKRDA